MAEESRAPTIIIYLSQSFRNQAVLRDVVSGVEEESIPYEVFQAPEDDGVRLAHRGAGESVLEVGIGVDSKGCIAVHYRMLPPESPLFHLNYNREADKIRSVCSNAARLVKGTPFILE